MTNLTVTSWSYGSAPYMILNWDDVTGAMGYEIERSTDGSNWTELPNNMVVPANNNTPQPNPVGQNVPSYTDPSVSAGGSYFYQVVTLDALGVASTSKVAYDSSTGPTVATPAAATSVTGNTTAMALSVSGADSGGPAGAANFLTYTWVTTAQPSGAATPRFSCNGTNKAQNTTATFYQVGNYTFQVTITDGEGLTATSSVSVTVSQTLTSIAVAPAGGLSAGGTLQFAATGLDQFGNALSSQPGFTWSTTGPGTISGSGGLYSCSCGRLRHRGGDEQPLVRQHFDDVGHERHGALDFDSGGNGTHRRNSYTGGTVVTGGTCTLSRPRPCRAARA